MTENDVYFTDINRLAVQDSAPESEHGVHTRPGKRLLKDCEKTGPLSVGLETASAEPQEGWLGVRIGRAGASGIVD